MSDDRQQPPPPRQIGDGAPPQPGAAPPEQGSLRALLEGDNSAYRRRIEAMLGVKRAPQFISSLITLANSSKAWKAVKPKSIIAAGAIAATLDLPIDKNLGFAWVIPYKDLAQFQIGYKGWIQLALRTGRYAGMNAVTVNEEALGGFDEIGEPIIYWEELDETKPAIGYAVAWKLTTGFTKVIYWSKEKVTAHAARYSQAYRAKKLDSPWFTEFDKMALKTVITNGLRKWGIMSVEYQELHMAFERDQAAAADVDAPPIYLDGSDADDDATGTREPIREPEPRQINAPQQAAGDTPESIKAGAARGATREPETVPRGGRRKRETKAERLAREAEAAERHPADAPPQQGGPAPHDAGAPPPFMQTEAGAPAPEATTPRGPVDREEMASPGSVQTIKQKMARATITNADLNRAFPTANVPEDLRAWQVPYVMEWLKHPDQPPTGGQY